MAKPPCRTFEHQLELLLQALHDGTYSPIEHHMQATILRLQSHEGSRILAANHVHPESGATLVTALTFEKQNSC